MSQNRSDIQPPAFANFTCGNDQVPGGCFTCSTDDDWSEGSFCETYAATCTISFTCDNNQACHEGRCRCNYGLMLKGSQCEIRSSGSEVWAAGAILNILTLLLALQHALHTLYLLRAAKVKNKTPWLSVSFFVVTAFGMTLARLFPVLLIFDVVRQDVDTNIFLFALIPSILAMIFALLINAVEWDAVIKASESMRARNENETKNSTRALYAMMICSGFMFVLLAILSSPTMIFIFGSLDAAIIGGIYIVKGLKLSRMVASVSSRETKDPTKKSSAARISQFSVRAGSATAVFVLFSLSAGIFQGTVPGSVLNAAGFAMLSYVVYISVDWYYVVAKGKLRRNCVASSSSSSSSS